MCTYLLAGHRTATCLLCHLQCLFWVDRRWQVISVSGKQRLPKYLLFVNLIAGMYIMSTWNLCSFLELVGGSAVSQTGEILQKINKAFSKANHLILFFHWPYDNSQLSWLLWEVFLSTLIFFNINIYSSNIQHILTCHYSVILYRVPYYTIINIVYF